MKLIELDSNKTSIQYEYGPCRLIVSKTRPRHLCITSFKNGSNVSPYEEHLQQLITIFMVDDENNNLSYLKAKMFSDVSIHIWEDTKFTRQLLKMFALEPDVT